MGKWVWRLFLLIVVALVVGAGFGYQQLKASLPQLEGSISLANLDNPVQIDRDAQGLVSIVAQSRRDAYVALGLLHAQERFFQMDLSRRLAAGELAELFGSAAIDSDKRMRMHQLKQTAKLAIEGWSAEKVELVEAYSAGVNQGLNQLESKPFEYWLLGQEPRAWQPEDTLLTVYAMFTDLNDEQAEYDATRSLVADYGSQQLLEYLSPAGTDWDSALDGSSFDSAQVPDESVIRLDQLSSPVAQVWEPQANILGSNSWAVAGALTSTGGAILANDMHLGLRLPNTWYRAELHYSHEGEDVSLYGVTLPGAPVVVVGSNTHVAWGFTNSYGDWSDQIVLEVDDSGENYRTSDGWRPFEVFEESIQVKGQQAQTVQLRHSHWGPVTTGLDGATVAIRWLAHFPAATNFNLADMALAKSLEQGIEVCQNSGIPPQNCLVVDEQGRIGWTLGGKMPLRGRTVSNQRVPWQQAAQTWIGWLAHQDYPKMINPPEHRLWTANARMMGDGMFTQVGDGGYATGARGGQIAQRLQAQQQIDEAGMLAIALDDEALFLERWRDYLQILLQSQSSLTNQQHAIVQLLDDWSGHAAKDDAAYTVVRQFHRRYRQGLYQAVQAYLEQQAGLKFKPGQLRRLRQKEQAMWQLANVKPRHWVPAPHQSWDEWMLVLLDLAAQDLIERHGHLQAARWGQHNQLQVTHPFARLLPDWTPDLISGVLSVPTQAMAGDTDMPRVQGRRFGASQRLIVSPGNEDKAVFHMPGGQSGHPLSPFFKSGHQDWVEGRPSPLKAGTSQWQLTLVPKS
ncbi:penicillin acylase family protein [Paraferrimonas sedimenticola]|uniref:Penicillin acylase n=1 Tax=Paraferrimonas sedimenticola TaxID=375674 RepID=A0AA37VZ46_9GAMM|nr:penicillin acylase family protein [Paraferrimonas sedimenticola]GLP97406.1 penicillin acylase [Paraferrimonas sedimenticola]